MDITRLVANIRRQIGVPGEDLRTSAEGDGVAPLEDLRLRAARLETLVEQMSQEAARVGVLPQHYPVHVDIVMRIIRALLPWYTRPISAFSIAAAGANRELAEIAVELARTQSAILTRLDALERETIAPAISPREPDIIHEDPHSSERIGLR